MTQQEALEALSSSSSHNRLKAARFLAHNSSPSDLDVLRNALRSENNSYVRSNLERAINQVSNSVSHEVEAALHEFEIPSDTLRQIRNKIMEEVTSQILHEIEPVVGLIAYFAKSEIEIDKYESSSTREHVERLQRILEAIRQLQGVAAPPRPKDIDLAELLTTIKSEVIGSDSIVEVSLHGPKPMLIRSDHSLLQMAVSNIMRNAVEAVIAVSSNEPHPIIVTWGKTDVDYWITVLDRGPGIVGPTESAFGIGKTTKKGHTGYGLAIVKQAIERLGGACTLQPGKEGGALFEIRLVER